MKKQFDPYVQMADLGGVAPVMQNTGNQQSMMQTNMGALGNLTKAAYNPSGGVAPYDPSAMAKALRASKEQEQGASFMDRASQYFGSQATPDLQMNVADLGSNTWNPLSDYNLGTNGWGNYGE
jgi:hypothetical protein